MSQAACCPLSSAWGYHIWPGIVPFLGLGTHIDIFAVHPTRGARLGIAAPQGDNMHAALLAIYFEPFLDITGAPHLLHNRVQLPHQSPSCSDE